MTLPRRKPWSLFLSYFNYYLNEVYLSDNSSGKSTVKSQVPLLPCIEMQFLSVVAGFADLGPSVSALM